MPLPRIVSTGGPLLLSDLEVLREWRGGPNPPAHGPLAREALGQGNPASMIFGGRPVVVWHCGGSGAVYLTRVTDFHISVVCVWAEHDWDDVESEAAAIIAATTKVDETVIARITITSGYLLVLWAEADGAGVTLPSNERGNLTGLSHEHAAAYVRLPCGRYEITTCEWGTASQEVLKLDLIWADDLEPRPQ